MGNAKESSSEGGAAKLLKGSLLIIISNFILRVGGYFYRMIMARLLGPIGYGLLGVTLPFQGIFQILAAGGLPPAIAKYVSQHKALGEDAMARQVLFTTMKFMALLGIFFSMVMFFSSDYIAIDIFHKPLAALPLKAVALITPFSVIVGAFRGAFQGLYRMEYVVVTRLVEQVFMIIFATILVMIGFYAAGAVIGTAIGFAGSAVAAALIFKKFLWKELPKPAPEDAFNFRQEVGLIIKLLKFSIPVIITALAEMAIYDISVFVLFALMATEFTGYYTSADPIARLPLVISTSVATAVLPAASEAFALKNKDLLQTYVVESYRLVILTVLPMCMGILIFSKPILELLFSKEYVAASGALSILVVGMSFYTLYVVSASIIQGIGYPQDPMYILVLGTIINLILNFALVPILGLEGAALATTIATFIIMVLMVWRTFKVTEITPPYKAFIKIILASAIMGLSVCFFPQSITGLFAAIPVATVVYIVSFLLLKGFTKKDVKMFRKFENKLGPLAGMYSKIINIIDRYSDK